MVVFWLCITVFFSQLVFIGTRTWNVREIAKGNITGAVNSGNIVHLSWLISITVGVTSMSQIILNWDPKFIPVVVASLSGSALGTILGMINIREKLSNLFRNAKTSNKLWSGKKSLGTTDTKSTNLEK